VSRAAIKHIKEEKQNFKAYIFRKLLLKLPHNESSLYNGYVTKKSATKHFRDWIFNVISTPH
ncbi:hypothetical protein RhiirC2_746333, partial [Rhizophagus irregularis]